MNRNTEKIDLFGEELQLSERKAQDVLAFSEFAKTSPEGISTAIYQAALIVEASLRCNIKEIPDEGHISLFRKILRFLWKDRKYKSFNKAVNKILEFNFKLKAVYLLDNLTQKELFGLVRKVYALEGIDLDAIQTEATSEKKN